MIASLTHSLTRLSADEAASLIKDGQTVSFSGFTSAGTPKAVPMAIARRAEAEHCAGRPFKIGVVTGASTTDMLDGALARAKAIRFRTPYQSDPVLREAINRGETEFFDVHLSTLPQSVPLSLQAWAPRRRSVRALVTENGVADLRALGPRHLARLIIGNCAHPSFRPDLEAYPARAHDGRTPFNPDAIYAMHKQFLERGDMHGVDWNKTFG